MVNKELEKFILNNRKFLSLSDGETVEGEFVGCESGIGVYKGVSKPVVRYQLRLNGMDPGKSIMWECGRFDVADTLKKIPFGTKISITRTGLQNDTKYDIKVIEPDAIEPTIKEELVKPATNGNPVIDKSQYDSVVANCKAKGITGGALIECLKKSYGVNSLARLPAAYFNAVIEWILKADYPKKAEPKKDKELIEEEVPF